MKKIIISPYSQILSNGKKNAKDYPHWVRVIRLLKENSIHTIHITLNKDEDIGADEIKVGLNFCELKKLLLECDTFISGDNFFQHFATYNKKIGVCIFSKSDPSIFGYEQNINLLKDKKYLRSDQFGKWEDCLYDADAFIEPEKVVNAIMSLLK